MRTKLNLLILNVFAVVLLSGCFDEYMPDVSYMTPATVGESYELNVFFWDEVEGADSYTFYWYVEPGAPECSKEVDDYQKLENVTAQTAGVEVIDCQEILEPGNYGLSGPIPEGSCFTFRFDAGPWDCGDFVCWDVYSDDQKLDGSHFAEHFAERSQGLTIHCW
jgi:hypothetical protein